MRTWFSGGKNTDKYQVPQRLNHKQDWKNLRMQEMQDLDLAFICLFQQDMQIPPLWHHCLISPHQCLMAQPLSRALSQHHCVISSWPCEMGWKAAHKGESIEGPLNRSPKGLKISWSSYEHLSREIIWAQKNLLYSNTAVFYGNAPTVDGKIIHTVCSNEGARNTCTSLLELQKSCKVYFPLHLTCTGWFCLLYSSRGLDWGNIS